MRINQSLWAQHIYQMFKKHWKVQGVRRPIETGALTSCDEHGIPYEDISDVVNPKKPIKPPVNPEENPLWNSRSCCIHNDSNVLVNGMDQAQLLTKTLVFNELPRKLRNIVNSTKISPESNKYFKNAILTAHLFDAEQKKLAIKKDPLRPAWNFPRDYGITDQRKCRLIIAKLLLECEKLVGFETTTERRVLHDVLFHVPFDKDEVFYQFEYCAETFISSKNPINNKNLVDGLSPVSDELPEIYPLTCDASIPQTNLYSIRNIYPISNEGQCPHPHTIFLHYSPLDVKNLFDLPVTETQQKARSLLKAFAVAAAKAQAVYGENVKQLPEPITVQSVHVNNKSFYFGMFQLNTLELNGTAGTKNYWFDVPPMDLYSECAYIDARPTLIGYNPDVLKYALGFYNNN